VTPLQFPNAIGLRLPATRDPTIHLQGASLAVNVAVRHDVFDSVAAREHERESAVGGSSTHRMEPRMTASKPSLALGEEPRQAQKIVATMAPLGGDGAR